MAVTCVSLPAGGGDRPCCSAGRPRASRPPAPHWSSCFSAPGPCRGESPWLLGPWPPLPGLLGFPVPVVSSLRCLCRDPIFFGHQDSCQVSCSDVPPPAPSSSSPSPGGPGNTQSQQRVGIPGSRPQPCGGSLGNERVEPGPQFPISEGRARWDAGSALPCTPPIGNELGFCTPPS